MDLTTPQYYPISVFLYNPQPQPVVNAQQGDSGRGLQITLIGNGSVLTPGNEVINLYALKPDGTKSYLECKVSGNYILCQFTNQMLAVPGFVQIQIQIVFQGQNGATVTLSTTVCIVNVLPTIIDQNAIESENEFTALENALAELAYYRENGLVGPAGQAATVSVGTVTASDPGSNPQITNSGTENAAVLNFVLPRGEQGPQGPPGQGVVFGAYSSFPNPCETNVLYVDNTVNPALAYVWNGSAYIPAGGGGEISAEDVTYDNSTSGLNAKNVKGAIDENAAAIKGLNTAITSKALGTVTVQNSDSVPKVIPVDSQGYKVFLIIAAQSGWGVTGCAVVVPAVSLQFSITVDYGNGYAFNVSGSYDGTNLTVANKYGASENEYQITIIGLIA